MRTVTGKTKAWITQYTDPERLKGNDEAVVGAIHISPADMKSSGWTCVGEATVTIELVDENTLVANKVESLKKELQTVRAEAQRQVNDLEDKLQKLLAITCDVVT